MIKKLFDHFEEAIAVLIMFVLLVVLFIQVFTRFVLNDPAIWTEELSRVLFIYMALFGSSAAIRTRSHVRIDFLVNFLPFRPRVALAILLDIVVIVVLVILVKLGYDTAVRQSMLSMVSLDLPMTVFYAGFPIAMGLMGLRLIQCLVVDIKAFVRNESIDVVMQKPRV